MINTPMDISVSYIPFVLAERNRLLNESILLLSAGATNAIILRPDAKTLRVNLPQGLFASVFDRIFRNIPAGLTAGSRIDLPQVSITVNALTADGRPCDLSYVFKKPLEDAGWKWFCWTAQGVTPFMLPAVGGTVNVPRPPHFLKLIFTGI